MAKPRNLIQQNYSTFLVVYFTVKPDECLKPIIRYAIIRQSLRGELSRKGL